MNYNDPDLQPLEILISKGTVNHQNSVGETPLHWATLNPHKFLKNSIFTLKAHC